MMEYQGPERKMPCREWETKQGLRIAQASGLLSSFVLSCYPAHRVAVIATPRLSRTSLGSN